MPSTLTLLTGFIIAATLSAAVVLWAAQGEANEDGLVIAVFAPTADERTIMQAIVQAEGTFVRASLPDTIVIAHSTQTGFADRLRAQGAWLTYGQSPFGNQLAGCLALATVPYEPALLVR